MNAFFIKQDYCYNMDVSLDNCKELQKKNGGNRNVAKNLMDCKK